MVWGGFSQLEGPLGPYIGTMRILVRNLIRHILHNAASCLMQSRESKPTRTMRREDLPNYKCDMKNIEIEPEVPGMIWLAFTDDILNTVTLERTTAKAGNAHHLLFILLEECGWYRDSHTPRPNPMLSVANCQL